MAGHTNRLNLYLPGGGSSGLYLPDEQLDIDRINDNMKLIDAAMGYQIVTSTTRPATPFIGQPIFETDSKRTPVWDGAAWNSYENPVIVALDADRVALAAPVLRDGLQCYVKATGIVWLYAGTTWVQISGATNTQLDTTNSLARTIPQEGRGRITGVAASSISKVVTFPIPFTSIPNVQANYVGGRTPNGGAFNQAGLVEVAPLTLGKPITISTTGFTMVILRTDANLTATYDYYFNWFAVGTV